MNQFSFNLDQNYLQHDKFGAHYSKNWDKKKQDEYNAWYYKTHKDKWKRINEEKLKIAKRDKDEIRSLSNRAEYERKEGLLGDRDKGSGYASKMKKWAREDKQYVRDIIKANQNNSMDEKSRWYRMYYHRSEYQTINDTVTDIQKDRSKGINMVKFDVYHAKKKVSSALNKIKNIKL